MNYGLFKSLAVFTLIAGLCTRPAHVMAVESKTPPPLAQQSSSILTGGKNIPMSDVYVRRLQKLRKQGVTVFYPLFVPAGFSLSSVKIVEDDDKAHPDYAIEFTNKKHLTFSVESAYSGIGDAPDGDRILKGKSKEFGDFTIDVFKPNSEGNGTKEIYYLGSWLDDKDRLAGMKRHETMPPGRSHHFLGNGVTDKEAVQIVESLAAIKR